MPEANGSTPDRFDVVIIGLGPVGATLANLLGLQGVSTLVLERETEAYHLPRALMKVIQVFDRRRQSSLPAR